ncbi:MAG: AzlC family ABC transporter permease [Clostridia bacterium]|nr:AzlC family ABC transporter permease [Clostridia bacterium]
MNKNSSFSSALRAAFPHTLPVLAGFGVLGATYGILMSVSGFPFWVTSLISLTVFAGSMQFVAVNLLLGAFAPLEAFLLTLMINARHIFYGISMLDRYKATGIKKLYLIFGMCDETFSINCTAKVPEDVDEGKFFLATTLLNQSYWVIASTVGGIFGSIISFETRGIEFVMTAMFFVILVDRLREKKARISGIIGLLSGAVCLAVFGADVFILPTMAAILLFLTLLRPLIDKEAKV